MFYKFEEGKDLIINAVVDKVMQNMAKDQALLCAEFVRQFYGTVAFDDLSEWNIEDLYGAAINLWSLIQTRAPHESKIHMYNPDVERNGWQTTHTVIEVITEDMPFLVDSLRLVLSRLGVSTHLVIHLEGFCVKRDQENQIVEILKKAKESSTIVEAPVFIQIDRQTNPQLLQKLHENFERVLEENRAVVEDWLAMRERVREVIDEIQRVPMTIDRVDVAETEAFLRWIEDNHFTFLGVRDYQLITKDGSTFLEALPETGLGILRASLSKAKLLNLSTMSPEARELSLSEHVLAVMSKTNARATIHRNALADYIGVKRFDANGHVIGERRIIGLYTAAAYNVNPRHIPFLRHKVALVMKNSQLDPASHAGKVLLNIIETLPRDDLIQATEDQLLELAMGIYYMQERRRIRLFCRTDLYRRFVSCLVYVPKERFDTELCEAMQKVLQESFDAQSISFSTWFSESVLARIHFIVKTNPKNPQVWDFKEIEQKLIKIGRLWQDDLQYYLLEILGEEQGNLLFARYKSAFSPAYTESFSPRIAVYDIKHIEELSATNPLVMNFYRSMNEGTNHFHLKIYQRAETVVLSDVIPIIERLGMKALSERSYELRYEDETSSWINEFVLEYANGEELVVDTIKELFQNAFANVWAGIAENDGFNQLVLAAGLDSRQVMVLRAYAKYFKQIRFTFSQDYIESTLVRHPAIARKLWELFEIRFKVEDNPKRENQYQVKMDELLSALDSVTNLDEDKIIRQYMHAITASIRTNYYQFQTLGGSKSYLSIKFLCRLIPGLPTPCPLYEIFIYSPRFEGVHLRHGKVARGGIRWSDRKEDFRTEILGLVKAQQVKNALIVPSGAKGGFVPKQLPINGSREEIMAEAVACYQNFIRGLLDLTDNYRDNLIIKPLNVHCYDDDDPYLVVAADKGTATFSDIANAISSEYAFWLGDAFASGGSQGYDHKKIGITARGAWESVKRHFYEMGKDINNETFTVVGIGDMSGDVFGNGMLLSRKIKLIGAFNHEHIFVDPDPDPELSFKERERLFHLPRSSWLDYNKKCISKGGGVFNRAAKSIAVSKEMKALLGIKQAFIEPNELVRLLLQAPVDLLWSAGIGTFVKAKDEPNLNVGDKTNDAIRVNANELRCKVVGEGGNLGLTQLARVEYALLGGYIYTDFIDNSAGVSCSDKEVNIKILLDNIVAAGDLTKKQRDKLLVDMTDEIAEQVLRDNFTQTRSINLTLVQAFRAFELHSRYMAELERTGKIDRALEFLPDDKGLLERKVMGKGMGRPGISVLQAYSKTILKEQILATNIPDDPALKTILIQYFPTPLQERFSQQMDAHRLKREIIATRLSNMIVNEMSFSFIFRMQDETGATVSSIVKAYMIVRTVFDVSRIFKQIEDIEPIITAEKEAEFKLAFVRLLRRATRWFVRNRRSRLNIDKSVKAFMPCVLELKKSIPDILTTDYRADYEKLVQENIDLGISRDLSHELTLTRPLFSAMDIIHLSLQFDIPVKNVAQLYFGISDRLELGWIRNQIIIHTTENNWESLSREALRDDLDLQQRQLTEAVIRMDGKRKEFIAVLDEWSESQARLIERWHHILSELRSSPTLNYTMFFAAIRELLDLTQTTVQLLEKEQVS